MTKVLSHHVGHFGPAHHMLAQFVARPEYGTTPEDPLVPSYWMHVARKMQPGAFIRVMPEGLPWIADYVVIDCDEHAATVKLMSLVDLTGKSTKKDAKDSFKIDRSGRWVRVIRKDDMKVIRGNFTNEVDAEKWIAENTEG